MESLYHSGESEYSFASSELEPGMSRKERERERMSEMSRLLPTDCERDGEREGERERE